MALARNDNDNNRENSAATNVTISAKPSTSYPAWHSAVSGGVAGAGSRIMTAPLDLLRIRRQLTPATQYPRTSLYGQLIQIVQTEGGVTALFRGNLAAVHLWVGYAAVQFVLYEQTKQMLRQIGLKNETGIAFVAGATAGVCATLSTYPFDVCRTAFAARGKHQIVAETTALLSEQRRPVPFSSLVEPTYHQSSFKSIPTSAASAQTTLNAPPRSISDFILQLYRQRGLAGFYAGAHPAVLQIIPYMGVNFAIYDYMSRDDKRVILSGSAGVVSGSVSKLLVYPMDTVKRRLQAQAFFGTSLVTNTKTVYGMKKYTGTLDCIQRIFRDEGFLSFYRGAFLSVMKSTIATGMTFAFFRFSKNVLESLHDGTFFNVYSYRSSQSQSTSSTPALEKRW